MWLSLFSFDLAAIDKPTIIFVVAVQVIVVAFLFLLVRLYKIFLPALSAYLTNKKKVQDKKTGDNIQKTNAEEDTNAAIAMALYLHFNELHDEESNVITIQRISKTYSPWSSKIYNMRNFR